MALPNKRLQVQLNRYKECARYWFWKPDWGTFAGSGREIIFNITRIHKTQQPETIFEIS